MVTRIAIALFAVLVLVSAAFGDWDNLLDAPRRGIVARKATRILKDGFVVVSALTRASVDGICAAAEELAAHDRNGSKTSRISPAG